MLLVITTTAFSITNDKKIITSTVTSEKVINKTFEEYVKDNIGTTNFSKEYIDMNSGKSSKTIYDIIDKCGLSAGTGVSMSFGEHLDSNLTFLTIFEHEVEITEGDSLIIKIADVVDLDLNYTTVKSINLIDVVAREYIAIKNEYKVYSSTIFRNRNTGSIEHVMLNVNGGKKTLLFDIYKNAE